jgi:hypothetical protein
MPLASLIVAGLVLAVLAGCAGSGAEPITTATAEPAKPAAAGSTLSEDELKLDCAKLTGRMQVRLLQLRGYNERSKSSAIGRTMQQVAKPVFGGTSAGADPDARYADDVARLRAYNARLAELKCATYDLDKELAAKPSDPTPAPVPLPRKK